jgi:hypothetical protein
LYSQATFLSYKTQKVVQSAQKQHITPTQLHFSLQNVDILIFFVSFVRIFVIFVVRIFYHKGHKGSHGGHEGSRYGYKVCRNGHGVYCCSVSLPFIFAFS